MPFAIAITAMVAGGILIYSGFKDMSIWQAFLSLLQGR